MDFGYLYAMTEDEYYLFKQVVEAEIADTVDKELRQAFPDEEPTEQELEEMWEAL